MPPHGRGDGEDPEWGGRCAGGAERGAEEEEEASREEKDSSGAQQRQVRSATEWVRKAKNLFNLSFG